MITHNYSNYQGIQSKIESLPHILYASGKGSQFSNNVALPAGSIQGSGYGQQWSNNLFNQPKSSFQAPVSAAPAPSTAPSGPVESPVQTYDPYGPLRAEISSAWDSYLGSLGDIGSTYLPQQRTAQEDIANSQLSQGQNTINSNKASSLRDIASTTKNAFQAGNNYLGSLGAGDSSAANQYSFAINQQANKQTGDLNNFVNTQLQDLQSKHDQQMSGIAQWFATAQEQLKQQIASGQLQKSQDIQSLSKSILDQAMQATNALKTNTQNQYNALVEWAANNSQNVGQLGQNIANVGRLFSPGQINMIGQKSATPMFGGSVPSTKTDIFGNPI